MPDNQAMLDAEKARGEYGQQLAKVAGVETKLRTALERLQAGVYHLNRQELREIIDAALKD